MENSLCKLLGSDIPLLEPRKKMPVEHGQGELGRGELYNDNVAIL